MTLTAPVPTDPLASERWLSIGPAPHPDPMVRRFGFGASSDYVERCWMPILGPTGTVILRRLPSLHGSYDIARLARSFGLLGSGLRRPFRATLSRLAHFELLDMPDLLTVHYWTSIPPIPARLLGQLPGELRSMQFDLLEAHLTRLAEG